MSTPRPPRNTPMCSHERNMRSLAMPSSGSYVPCKSVLGLSECGPGEGCKGKRGRRKEGALVGHAILRTVHAPWKRWGFACVEGPECRGKEGVRKGRREEGEA
eukprot:189429-Chlamydomonas_euryale.AAC.3